MGHTLSVKLALDLVEIIMPSLKGMNVQALMSLRTQIDRRLAELRAELEKDLAAITGQAKAKSIRTSKSLKGRKVAPKYRGPSGETWAGRGARPRWLVAAIRGGKRLENFLIDKSERKGRKKRRGKR
jgi:DNA-binding protein H-NS